MFRSEIAGHVPILENALQKTYKTLKYQLDKNKDSLFPGIAEQPTRPFGEGIFQDPV